MTENKILHQLKQCQTALEEYIRSSSLSHDQVDELLVANLKLIEAIEHLIIANQCRPSSDEPVTRFI